MPLVGTASVRGSSHTDVWTVGSAGVAHYDGSQWARVANVDGQFGAVANASDGTIHIGGDDSLWVGTPTKQPAAVETVITPSAAASRVEPKPLSVAALERGFRVTRVTVRPAGQPPLKTALGVATLSSNKPGGPLWLYDRTRCRLEGGAHPPSIVVGTGGGGKPEWHAVCRWDARSGAGVAGASIPLELGLVWVSHVGIDRVLGYGLKYRDGFHHSSTACTQTTLPCASLVLDAPVTTAGRWCRSQPWRRC